MLRFSDFAGSSDAIKRYNLKDIERFEHSVKSESEVSLMSDFRSNLPELFSRQSAPMFRR